MQEARNSDLIQCENTISVQYIVDFIADAWKIVLIATSFGLFAAIAYLMFAPKTFEAIAQVKMAQISNSNPANPFGVVVEEPSTLIARMRMPTNYKDNTVKACGLQDDDNAAESLAKGIVFLLPKGLSNAIEFKVRASSPEGAYDCANAVVEQIVKMQSEYAKPLLEEAKTKLVQDNERIESSKRLIAVSKSGLSSATYLSARDEIAYYLADREKMLDLINSIQGRGARLISPIYVPAKAVFPDKKISLMVGLCVGFFLGLFFAWARQSWANRPTSIGLHL